MDWKWQSAACNMHDWFLVIHTCNNQQAMHCNRLTAIPDNNGDEHQESPKDKLLGISIQILQRLHALHALPGTALSAFLLC